MKRLAAWLTLVCWLAGATAALAQGIGVTVGSNPAQIFVSGRELHFANLGTAHGIAVVRVDDDGMKNMLSTVGARLSWQPGTRFVAITRADGTLVTFTVGSNAVSVGDRSQGIPLAPFYQGNQLYLPLVPLAEALGLGVHRFPGGFAFLPQIVSAQRKIGQRRTVLEIRGSTPLTWRTSYSAKAGHATLTLQFPGFKNAATPKLWLGGRDARAASFVQSGPPGFPITTINIDVQRGVHFTSHRLPSGTGLDVIFARDNIDLRVAAVATTPSVVVTGEPLHQAVPLPAAPASHAPAPAPASASPAVQPVPTAQPVPADQSAGPASESSAQPGESPDSQNASAGAGAAPSPAASEEPLQKISDVFVTDSPDASRITLVICASAYTTGERR